MENPRGEYQTRLNRVLNYIHTHLDQSLSLEALSSVAGFSPFHFHRLFHSLVGETVFVYVQRVRLEKAAYLLAYWPEYSILETGMACGFSGAAVFTRAFRARFDCSPSEYRRKARAALQGQDRKISKEDRKQRKEWAEARGYNESEGFSFQFIERSEQKMNVEVKNLPVYHVAYIRHLSGYSKGKFNSTINEAFERVCKWAGAHSLLDSASMTIGVPYDNPDITPNDRCRYDACVTVPEQVAEGTGEVGIQDLRGGAYAVCRIDIPSSQTHTIGETVDRMYGEWLPSSGYTVDDRPALEIYYNNPDQPPGTWIKMDFCIPVRPL